MSQRTTVSILIVNEHAEEIKLATIGLRGFFSNCRVDAAYSAEEARTLASTQAPEWSLILIDDGCLSGPQATLIEDLKRHAVHAAVLLQSDRSDAAAAIQAMQGGADFFLAKQSPAFLTELLFCAREAVEKRELRMAVARSEARHQQLLESLPDVLYELDADGRFLAVGPNVAPLLGYTPQELIGSSYTVVFSSEHEPAARFRFNERRSGARSIQRMRLTLQRKPSPDQTDRSVPSEISARGLYDQHRRFLGTVGVICGLLREPQEPDQIRQPTQQTAQVEHLRAMISQITVFSEELQRPLAALRDETGRLLETVRATQLGERLEQLTQQAASAATVGDQLARTLQGRPSGPSDETINDLLKEVLGAMRSDREKEAGIIAEFAQQLPAYRGNRAQAIECIRLLLSSALTFLATLGRRRKLIVRTVAIGSTSEPHHPVLGSLSTVTAVEIECLESEQESEAEPASPLEQAPPDLLNLYRLVTALEGTIDLSAPVTGPLRLLVRLPTISRQPREAPPERTIVSPPFRLEQEAAPRASPKPAPAGQASPQDRRASARVLTTLQARLTVDSTIWEGTITNLGLGGACITVSPDFPSVGRQDVFAVLRTAVGILELNASAYIRPAARTAQQKPTAIHLIIVFHPPKATEAAILISMIDAARERSLSLSLDVLLTTEPQDMSHSDVDRPDDDRRESIRVSIELPVRLETDEPSERGRLMAQAVNISRQGACLLVKASSDGLRGSLLLHFATGKTTGHPGPHEPGAPDSAMPARILWAVPDATAPSQFRPHHSVPAARIGVRFLSLTPYAERELTRLLRQHLTSPQLPQSPSDQTSVLSIHRECRNHRGQAIAILDDHLRQPLAPETPIVIIAPGYGQTARDYSALSYYMAHHRLRVLRYDHSNHVGLSDGELQNTTLRGMQADLAKVVEYVHHTWPTSRIVVLASDLAARAALKMAVQAQPVDFVILVNPVVDVGTLLMAVHGHDLVADFRYGLRRGITNLLGFNVNLDQFVGDLIAGRLTDLASTLEDIRLLRSALAIVTSPHDESSPLPPSDLPHAFMTALSTQTRMMSIPSALAGLPLAQQDPQPTAFRQVLEQIASVLTWPLPATEMDSSARDALIRQQRLELEQTRLLRNLSQISREAIGLAHLQQLPQLANLHDYRKLLDDLYVFLTPLDPGMIIVDAGIGQSDVIRAMLVNHAYRTRQQVQRPDQPPLLIGLGRSGDQVHQARQTVQTLQRELASGKSGGVTALSPLTIGWMRTDWTQALPFQSGSIHRIVCNLSLPFVSSPRATLQEWHRVLHPEGRLVFTTFHPGTDLSPLYRRHLRLANQDEFSVQAQAVLHYLGRLREAIRHGILHTFDQHALTSLLRHAGNQSFRLSPIFDGQAFVVIVGKRISSSSL